MTQEASDEAAGGKRPDGVVPDQLTQALGARIRDLRKAAGMSQSELGERMTTLGSPWSRTSVAKVEAGKRGAVTAQELLALALVFDLPPVWLLVDPTATEGVPIAAGVQANPWTALMWMTGRESLDPNFRGQTWGKASMAIEFARQLYNGVRSLGLIDWERTAVDEGLMGEENDPHDSNFEARELRILRAMREPITKLREWGYVPYPLPAWVLERAAVLGVQLDEAEG